MIGISAKNFQATYWDHELFETPFKHVEVDLSYNFMPYEERILQIIKKELSDREISISLHSAASDILHDHPIINTAQKKLMLSEVVVASKLEATDLIFHIPRTYSDEKKRELHDFLPKLSDLARSLNVSLVLENNAKYSFSASEEILELLSQFPDFHLCVDLGHLNIAVHNKFVDSAKSFINSLSHKIHQVHVHNNNGLTDSHSAIDDGSLDILSLIPLLSKDVRWIIETRNKEHAMHTYEVLRKILS